MRVFVVVANYGVKNDLYLGGIFSEYKSMSHDVDIAVISNVPKEFGAGIEVIVGMPTGDPHSLPFAHKQIFADRKDQYDLFIFTEDDILITQRNIEAFMEVTSILPKDRLAGFLRYEVYPDGTKNFDGAHHKYHWIPDSVETEAGKVFARFTNTHSGCYLLAREHLAWAINSGGFLVDPPKIKYGLIELNATHPYTQCGYEKVICISQLDDFIVHHLPNNYLGRLGTSESDLNLQVKALLQIAEGGRLAESPCQPEKKVPFAKWSKNYHEHGGEEVLGAIPQRARKILNMGGVMGIVEAELVSRGLEVVSIPIDSVVAPCIEAKGARVTRADLDVALKSLGEERFDCILMINIIQHLKGPVEVLSDLRKHLSPDGCIIIVAPKISYLKTWVKTIGERAQWWLPMSFERTQLHFTSKRLLERWLDKSGLRVARLIPNSDRKKIVMQCTLN